MHILISAILYFIFVFGAGFLLGPIRVLWIVPRVGVLTAELIEAPVMFVVIFFAAKWIVRRFGAGASLIQRLGIGSLALGFLLAVEIALTPYLWGLSFPDYLRARDPLANAAFFVMLFLFAIMPLFVARRTGTNKA